MPPLLSEGGYLYSDKPEFVELIFVLNYSRTNRLVKQMAKDEGVTVDIKRRDQMAWVAAMNNIRDRVNEIVPEQIIYY